MRFPLTYIIRISYILSGFFLVIFTLGYFFSSQVGNQEENQDRNISLILDVSQSMQVQDISEMSRLNAIKKDLDGKLQESVIPVGLTIFAGEAQRVLPFTTEKRLLLSVLQSVDSKNLQKQGTNLESALRAGLRQFSSEQTGTLILFSDGGEESIRDIKSLEEEVIKKGIQIIIVGVGTKKGGNILIGRDVFGKPVYKTYNGKNVISKLEDAALKDIAQELGGDYMTFDHFQESNILMQDAMLSQNLGNYIFFYLALIFWMSSLILLVIQKETGKL